MEITIEELEETIKDVLGDSDVLNTETVYEHIENETDRLKLVIFFNKLFGENQSVLYTKLIFVTDIDKINVITDSFLYLYDINCQYHNIKFDDLYELEDKLSDIINKNKFGRNLKILSEFIEKPSFLINDWLTEHNITNFSITSIKYNPKIHIIPCKSLFFSFDININNQIIELNITKEDSFVFSFNINNEIIKTEKQNLNTLIEIIANTLKNNIK